MALDNALATPGGMRVRGTEVDLGRVDVDTYIVSGSNDHIVDGRNACRSTQLLGGDSRFALSTSGHIQALVNPPIDPVWAVHLAAQLARERSGIAKGVERRREVPGRRELLRPRQLSSQRQRVNARRVVAARQRPVLAPGSHGSRTVASPTPI
jgi:hypothetical protein